MRKGKHFSCINAQIRKKNNSLFPPNKYLIEAGRDWSELTEKNQSPPCYHVCIVVTRRRIKSNRRKRELLAAIPNLLAAHRAIGNAIFD